ncbi:MAG TPA: CopG family transcriptional regulator [Candidatus Limnocylindria bacterium]|jgi:hypothetical protein
MQRKQIQFTRGQLTGIRGEARRQKVSESAVVRQAVDQLLQPVPGGAGDEERDRRIARALAVVGRFDSGRSDISRKHDRELTDTFRS